MDVCNLQHTRLYSSVIAQPAFLNNGEFYSVAATNFADYLGLGELCIVLGIGSTFVKYSNPTVTSIMAEAVKTDTIATSTNVSNSTSSLGKE